MEFAPESRPATPYVRIDLERVRRNIERMQGRASAIGATLRPHFKTHRTPWIACLQLEAGAIGLSCATAMQLDAARAVSDEILLTGPLQLDAATGAALRATEGINVLYSATSSESLLALRRVLGPDREAQLLLEVDSGCDRGGLDPEECPHRAAQARQLGLTVVGAFSYPGHGYAPRRQAAAAESEHRLLDQAGMHLTRAGFAVQHLSAGSSPTMVHARPGVATEYRPGTYVIGDVQQVMLGTLKPEDVAMTIIATVIACRDGQVVLNAGGKALGRDSPPWLEGYGRMQEDWDITVDKLYDHHAIIVQNAGAPAPAIGEQVALVPNNANTALAMRQRMWSDDGDISLTSHEIVGDD